MPGQNGMVRPVRVATFESWEQKMAVEVSKLLQNWSIEVPPKDVGQLERAVDLIPVGTKITIPYLPGDADESRISAARRIRELGYIPIPHISARRLNSATEFENFLEGLRSQAAIDHIFVVAGDPSKPLGPYADALAIIQTGLLARYGIKRVGISGYPEGHPDIGDDRIWRAKFEKRDELLGRGHDFAIVTQFSFDAKPMLVWAGNVRNQGIEATIRLGIPGPASVKRLLAFAARCGVGASTAVMKKYGLSVTRLLTTAGPDRLIADLAQGLDPDTHGEVKLHLYPFGGVRETAEWMLDFASRHLRDVVSARH